MKDSKIKFILIQIDEAHSTAWPVGLKNTPEPQKTFEERVERANKFVEDEKVEIPFEVLIDDWSNTFANLFRAWPDKYYCIDKDYKVLYKATYGAKSDALIDVDCTEIIKLL